MLRGGQPTDALVNTRLFLYGAQEVTHGVQVVTRRANVGGRVRPGRGASDELLDRLASK